MSRRGRGPALRVVQPDDLTPCPLLLAGTIRACTCAERQHARLGGSPRGAKYYPCSYLLHGAEKKIVFRCETGRATLYRMAKEWWPENWKPKKSDPRLVVLHAQARQRWNASHLISERIDGRWV